MCTGQENQAGDPGSEEPEEDDARSLDLAVAQMVFRAFLAHPDALDTERGS